MSEPEAPIIQAGRDAFKRGLPATSERNLKMDNTQFRQNWLVEDAKTGRQFVTLNMYRPSDFVEDGNLRPLRPATPEEVTARMAAQS